jgi:DNA segregation ATPase FtsK/SpoIIIE, S-DNA-T family
MAKKTQKTKPAHFDQHRLDELIGILLIIFGVMLLIAFVTFNAQDNPKDVHLGMVHNSLGLAGVWLSWYLIHLTIGYPVMVVSLLIIAWGVNRLLDQDATALRRWSIFLILVAYYVSLSGAIYSMIVSENAAPPYQFSGLLGVMGAGLLAKLLGKIGAVVLVVGLIFITVLVFTSVTYRDVIHMLSAFFSRIYVRTHTAFHQLLGKRNPAARLMPSTRTSASRTAAVADEEEEEDSEEEAPKEEKPWTPPLIAKPKTIPITIKPKPAPITVQDPEEEESEEALDDLAPVPTSVNKSDYKFPLLEYLQMPEGPQITVSDDEMHANARMLEGKLADFDIQAKVVEIHPGPVITRYELELAPGIKVSKITALADDMAMAMRAKRVRILAPIPGKAAVGIELPNPTPSMVYLRETLATPQFQEAKSPLSIGLGKTISGAPFIADLTGMPHLLIAGSTGSGKSVCLNTIITSFLYKAHPSEVQMIMIDPKRLELSTYARLYRHHLAHVEGLKEKVATSPKSAIATLKAVEQEMERRYELLAGAGVRNIEEYNQRVSNGRIKDGDPATANLSYLVLIIDELADLMMTSSAHNDVEEPIARLTQMSRAVGIHLIVATQRPSVDVITGVIKANFPARMAFQVATKVDSRTILDMNGAEKLLGRGDMLFLPPGSPEPIRIHNGYISLAEIEQVIDHINRQPMYPKSPLPAFQEEEEDGLMRDGFNSGKRDALFDEAMSIVVRTGQGSVSILQRRLKVGYSRAARLIDELEQAGVVGPFEGSKAREVLMSPDELEAMNHNESEEE